MMTAFITLKSSLVFLIEGLCAQIHVECIRSYSNTFTTFAFFFQKETWVQEKKAVNPRSQPASQHIYTRVYFVHMYEYAEIQSIWMLRALRVSRPDPLAHIRVHHVQCVCECVYTHKYTDQNFQLRQKTEKIQTTPMSSSCQKSFSTPATRALVAIFGVAIFGCALSQSRLIDVAFITSQEIV